MSLLQLILRHRRASVMEIHAHPGSGLWLLIIGGVLLSSSIASPQSPNTTPRNSSAKAKRASSNAAGDLAKRAEAAREAGDSAKATALYEQLVQVQPSAAEAWWYLGMLRYDANDFAKAATALDHVVQLKPKVGSGWTFLGLCEFEVGKHSAALEHLQKAKQLGFGDVATTRVATYHLGMLLTLNKQFDDATDLLLTQFGQEKLSAQIAVVLGLARLHMAILPADLDVSKKELVFNAGQASAEMSHGRNAEALQLLQTIESEHPDVPYVRLAAAEALFKLSKMDDAAAQLGEELKLAPKNKEALQLLSEIRVKQNRPADAINAAQAAVDIDPSDAKSHYLFSVSLTAAGQADKASQELQRAKTLGWTAETTPSESPALAMTSSSDAGDDARFEEIKMRANAAQQSGDMPAAMQAYREALEIRPNWAEGILYLATFHYGAQQYDEALTLARRLSGVQPNVGATWALLGLCEFQLGDYENSLVHLTRGQDIGFPEGSGGAISEANYHIGILQNWKGDFGPAHDLLLREAKAGHRAEEAKFALGINLMRLRLLPDQVPAIDRPMIELASSIAMDLSRSDYGPATTKFDQLLKTYPGRPNVHDAYGWTLMSISRYDAAAVQYREEIRLAPTSAEGYLGVATAGLKTHKYEEARDAAKKAVELSPESAMAHGQYGRALIELGDVKLGTSELEKAVDLAIQIPELHYSLSRAYTKANRPKDAERERQIFLRLNNQNKKD